jgi:phosphate acetyltransferase
LNADAKKCGADLSGCQIQSPLNPALAEPLALKLFEYRKEKGLTLDQARTLIKDYLYFATMLLKEGQVDGYVAGATHTTGDNLRPALQIIKARKGLKTVSTFFLMLMPDTKWGEKGVLLYADCGMNEMPTAEQLADIAVASAVTFKQLVGPEPRIAMLSYSTKGSAKSTDTEKVIKATQLAKQIAPDLIIDGEMQGDAALIPSVGARKCKGSPVAGRANCLIFPDLDAGNIGYKLTERLAGAQALGPLVQGMAKPAHDLSRGCSVDDIVKVAAIAAIMAE